MKYLPAVLLCLIFTISIQAQQARFIEVTGSAEMLIDPDEVIFNIGIAEFWKGEFEKSLDKDSPRGDKVKILDIEKQLLKDLKAIGIKKDRISSTDVGTYWRGKNEEIRLRKSFEISLTDFSLINRIISEVNTLGIDYMRIGELKHKDIAKYRVEVKKQALLAAREKATYLAETLGKTTGDVLAISEVNRDRFYSDSRLSNTAMESNSSSTETEKKIKLRYEIVAKFEIIDN